ncbi:uncharacterized protein CCOS01_11143 [Colletotrichum costaricense]|uniref:Uncharacterized protein n=1 Tax=Colletotrichum costaricense TaxID=1209916 RepID=A0AAJ0DXT2_9PEZI|nr:uncharacterized protein CCOS01_11143 [Colletotrichum costaricense]KAI3544690.1 hypothetical protein CSPX01_05490 [Colletotrichum filicis]KAK1519492.1 hypothetical protein CCOS01_11143 [Colletotrichum costaricense]
MESTCLVRPLPPLSTGTSVLWWAGMGCQRDVGDGDRPPVSSWDGPKVRMDGRHGTKKSVESPSTDDGSGPWRRVSCCFVFNSMTVVNIVILEICI